MDFSEGGRGNNFFGTIIWSAQKDTQSHPNSVIDSGAVHPFYPNPPQVNPSPYFSHSYVDDSSVRSGCGEDSVNGDDINYLLGIDNVGGCAFLGDELSTRNRDVFGAHHFQKLNRGLRTHSLDSLNTKAPGTSLMKIPVRPADTSLPFFLESISPHSWMMPYIIACSPPINLKEIINDSDVPSCTWPPSGGLSSPRRSLQSMPTINEDGFVNNLDMSSRYGNVFGNDRRSLDVSNLTDPVILPSSPPRTANRPVSPWRSLGIVLVSADPSWEPWEPRLLIAFDNYLFDCNIDASAIIGFAQLNKSEISSVLLRSSNHSPKQSNIPQDPNHVSQVLAIHISYLSQSLTTSIRKKVWLRGQSFQETVDLQDVLTAMAEMTVNEVYDFNATAGENSILSSGRATEVRMAKRRASSIDLLQRPHLGPLFGQSDFQASRQRHSGFFVSPAGASSDLYNKYSSRDQFQPPQHPLATATHPRPQPLSLGHGGGGGFINNMSPSSEGSYDVYVETEDMGAYLPSLDQRVRKNFIFSTPPIDFTYCALKTINKEQFYERVLNRQERSDCLVREVLSQVLVSRVAVLQGIDTAHSPIVDIYGVFESVDVFCMELELMRPVDLCDRLHEIHRFTESETRLMAVQLLRALRLCRTAGVAHRDVKLSNITIARSGSTSIGQDPMLRRKKNYYEDLKVKLADFGMAGLIGPDGLLYGRCGTMGYVAPEILRAGVHEGYGNNVDMFSLGVVVYTLLSGHEPFYGTDPAELKEANKNATFSFKHKVWRAVSNEAKDWITVALNPNPAARMNPEEALRHPWLQDVAEVYL